MFNYKLVSIGIAILLFGCNRSATPNSIVLKYSPREVELFGENIISTGLYERDLAISLNGDEIIYSLSDYKQNARCLISIKKEKDKWGNKEVVSFSGLYMDIEPFFSVDGNQLYFASNRPIYSDSTRSDYNIWVSEKVNSTWGEPTPLSNLINTDKDEFYPSLSKNGNLYFTAAKKNGIGKEDIFISKYVDGQYQTPEPLDTNVNSVNYEFNAYIHPNEEMIVFSSYGRSDDLGGGDLYISVKDDTGNWSPAKNLGDRINSDKLDYCPFIDIQNANFYFTSENLPKSDKKIKSVAEMVEQANSTLNGMGNIYRISVIALSPP